MLAVLQIPVQRLQRQDEGAQGEGLRRLRNGDERRLQRGILLLPGSTLLHQSCSGEHGGVPEEAPDVHSLVPSRNATQQQHVGPQDGVQVPNRLRLRALRVQGLL